MSRNLIIMTSWYTAGFDLVFPLSKLSSFSPEELRLVLCGDQVPSWTREDVIAFTEPKLGFTRERFVSSSHRHRLIFFL